jgi:uncharacterized repeat protein (TIGR03803 family)
LRPPSGYKSIFAFDFTDGAAPYAGIIYASGRLYDTTYADGSGGTGTVFKITTGGSEKVLHSGTLHGTAVYGGASGRTSSRVGWA